MRNLIHISAFFRKEIAEILRQPRFIASLIVGPFLILLLFGLGYRNQPVPQRTVFVMGDDNPFLPYIQEYTANFDDNLIIVDIVPTVEEAQRAIRSNRADLAIRMPDNPLDALREGKHAVFVTYHNQIDPYMINYVRVFTRIYTTEVNRRVLELVAAEGQRGTATFEQPLDRSRNSVVDLREALEDDDIARATALHVGLTRQVADAVFELESDNAFFSTFSGVAVDEDNNSSTLGGTIQRLKSNVAKLGDALTSLNSDQENFDAEIALSDAIVADIDLLKRIVNEISSIDARLLAQPFAFRTESVTRVELELTDYYVPGVLALLMQHIAVTFGAMSIVRERNVGSMELFRIAPISALETLLGKYAGYLVFDGLLAALLTVMVVGVLGTPLAGSWQLFAAVMVTLIFASLGIGFVISLFAETTTQAVQYSMIVLLASVFFSGFFLNLNLLWEQVRIVSWLLPVTYATQLLQGIMLRGSAENLDMLGSMFTMGVAFFMLAWLLLRRAMYQR